MTKKGTASELTRALMGENFPADPSAWTEACAGRQEWTITTGAKAIDGSLEALDVTDVFGIPCGNVMTPYDAVMDSSATSHILASTSREPVSQPGDPEAVTEGEAILEVGTDKVDTEVLPPLTGALIQILGQEGDHVSVGDSPSRITKPAEVGTAHGASGPSPEALGTAPPDTETAHAQAPAAAGSEPITPPPSPEKDSFTIKSTGTRTQRLTPVRRIIADRMMQSLKSTAQLTTVVEADVTAIAGIRATYRSINRKISYLPFITKATVDALAQHSAFNTTINDEGTGLTYHDAVNLGIAVDSPKGLMVPVIRNADQKSVDEMSAAIQDIAKRVRAGQIAISDLEGGSFTITNTGSCGALFDTPILNYPQTAILGIGTVVQRVVPLQDDDGLRIGVRHFAHLALTYDHRVVDGADAARFLSQIKENIAAQQPAP